MNALSMSETHAARPRLLQFIYISYVEGTVAS